MAPMLTDSFRIAAELVAALSSDAKIAVYALRDTGCVLNNFF